jgi:hypothetical protein
MNITDIIDCIVASFKLNGVISLEEGTDITKKYL